MVSTQGIVFYLDVAAEWHGEVWRRDMLVDAMKSFFFLGRGPAPADVRSTTLSNLSPKRSENCSELAKLVSPKESWRD